MKLDILNKLLLYMFHVAQEDIIEHRCEIDVQHSVFGTAVEKINKLRGWPYDTVYLKIQNILEKFWTKLRKVINSKFYQVNS